VTRPGRLAPPAPDRFSMFVPAAMGVGLVAWVIGSARELLRTQRSRRLAARAAVSGPAIAARIPGAPVVAYPGPEGLGLRPRPVYVLVACALLGGAVYVLVGAAGNFRRAGGYLSDIAWLLAAAWTLAAVAATYGLAAAAAAISAPKPPKVLGRLVRGSALSVAPSAPGAAPGGPSWRVTVGFWVGSGAFAALALAVGVEPLALRRVDTTVAGWVRDLAVPGVIERLDAVGGTEVTIGVAVLVAVVAAQCRVLALGYAMATSVALVTSVTLRPLVERARPPDGPLAGATDSFPSGHLLLATVMAGLVPVVVAVLTRRRSVIGPVRIVCGLGVGALALGRVSRSIHWPSDALGGILAGVLLVLAVQWVLDTPRAHDSCRRCLWHERSDRPHRLQRGLVPLTVTGVGVVRTLARASTAIAGLGLAVLTVTVDVPTNPDYTPFGAAVQRPVQWGLATLVSVGGLVAWRWPAPGAVTIAFAGAGLGLFASVEYPPVIAASMAAALSVPAVLTWLSWQHDRSPREITAVAGVTALLIGGTWLGATTVYEGYFGPTHPDSTAAAVPVDRVEWIWLGALSADGVTVTARLARPGTATLDLVADAGGTRRVGPVVAGPDRLVRFRVAGLSPETAYEATLDVDGRQDPGRGRARFRTPGVGPYSFRLALASCARTGSNGAVFDAIRATDPLLYVNLGDLHYENLTATTPGPFLDAFDRALGTPAQGALARAVPMAYVWDDHDYGPNDADATAPSRSAARAAYRAAVPHYDVTPGDAPINQAFTIGRVRIVMTDGRSERTATSLLGDEQRRWLIDEVVAASSTHAVVIWVNPTPWIGAATPGADTWAGFADERRLVADALAAAGVRNLVMVSGDAHMVAIDDGTDTDYSTGRVGGFPLLQAAALDRPGNVKGGPYSDGAFPGGGQFGLVDVVDDGGSVQVRLAGRTWDGRTLVERTIRFGQSRSTQ
jgi:membrane-associated phospholipid phosphatase